MAVALSVVGKFNGKDLDRAQKALNKLKTEAGSASSPLQRLGDSFKTTGEKMRSMGSSMTRNITLPLIGVGYAIGKTIGAASDLAETQSKVGVIFGTSAKDIEKFAGTAATAMGQSKQQAMDAAATFATFGKSAGLSGDKLVGFSTKFTTLASDMASFSNTSPEEAINAIGSALRGEAEPIRKYGVLLDDASMRQEAMRIGIIKTTKESLTPQQKVLAAQSLIFKQTSAAQGDFTRTSDGLANQQRILQAQLADTKTEMGQAFLPIALQLAGVFRDKVIPAIQAVADFFGGLSERTKTIAIIVGVAVAALGPMITVLGTLATAIGFVLSPIGLVVVAIAGLVAGAIYAYKHFEGFRKVVDDTFKTISTSARMAFGWLKENWKQIVDVITQPLQIAVGFVQRHFNTIKGIFESTFQVIKGIVQVFAGLFTGDWGRMWEGVKNIVAGAGKLIIGQIKLLVGLIWDTFKGLPGMMLQLGKNIVEGLWNGMLSMGGWLMDKMKGWASGIVNGIKGFFGISSPSKVMAELGVNVSEGLAIGIEKGSRLVEQTSSKLVKKTLNAAVKQAKNAQKVFDTIRDAAVKSLDEMKDKAQTVIDFAKGISDSMKSVGSITGFDTTANASAVEDLKSIDEQMLAQQERVNKAREALNKARVSKEKDAADEILQANKDLNDEMDSLGKMSASRDAAAAKVQSTKVTASNVIGDMASRLAMIKKFGEQLQALKDLGLNNSSLQQIISAGPEAGSEIAGALLSEGASAVGQVNSLESQLGNVAASIGDIGSMSQFGMNTGQAQATIDASVNIMPGAVIVNVGAGGDPAMAAALQASVNTAVESALKEIGQTSVAAATESVNNALKNVKQAVKTAKKTTKKGK